MRLNNCEDRIIINKVYKATKKPRHIKRGEAPLKTMKIYSSSLCSAS